MFRVLTLLYYIKSTFDELVAKINVKVLSDNRIMATTTTEQPTKLKELVMLNDKLYISASTALDDYINEFEGKVASQVPIRNLDLGGY